VSAIEFKQTGQPVGNDPDVGNPPDKKTRNKALRGPALRSALHASSRRLRAVGNRGSEAQYVRHAPPCRNP